MATTDVKMEEVKKVPAEAKASVIQPMLYKSVVTVYRIFAISNALRGARRRAGVRLCHGLLCPEHIVGRAGDSFSGR